MKLPATLLTRLASFVPAAAIALTTGCGGAPPIALTSTSAQSVESSPSPQVSAAGSADAGAPPAPPAPEPAPGGEDCPACGMG